MILRIRSENALRARTPLNGRARSAAWSMLGLVEEVSWPAASAEPFEESHLGGGRTSGPNGLPGQYLPRDRAPLLRPAAPESALASAFTLLTPGRPCWHAFSASVALHAVAILVLPIVSQRLFREDWTQRIRRERITQSLLIRIPEQFYLASPPAPTAPRPPARAAAAPAQPAPRTDVLKEPAASPPLVARRAFSPPREIGGRSGGAAPPQRRFELAPVLRAETDLTVLQSRQSARAMPRVQLPEMFFWAPPPPQRILRAFVQPGGAKPQAQRPRLDAPPRLDVPGATVLPSDSVPLPGAGTLHVPAPFSMPVQTAPAPPQALPAPPEIGVAGPGEPANILVLSASQAPLKEYVAIPPGNVVGRAPGLAPGGSLAGAAAGSDGGTGPVSSAGSGASGKGTGAGSPGSAAAASGAAVTASGTGGGGTGPAAAGSAAGATGTGAAGSGSGSGSAAGSGSGSGSATGAGSGGQGSGGTGAGPGGSGLTPALRAAIAATRMVNPSNGVFDLVVQSSGAEGFTESAGILSGRPVYSVFMNVGGPREWILQYCIPGSEAAPAEVSGGAVMLAAPGRLLAPYPLVTYRPPPRRSHARYLMLHGFISAEGRFEGLRVLGAADPLDAAAALAALERWELRPATEDRKPARIEVLVAIPGE